MSATRRWKLASLTIAMPLRSPARDRGSGVLQARIFAFHGGRLEAFLMRPVATGKYPLARISHGTPARY
jgi:hypothetical protein